MIKIGRTLEERFDEKFVAIGSNCCWLWTAAISGDGYGASAINRVVMGAHRISWEIHNSKFVPSGMLVLHKCDNRICVNPDHLFLGTHKDNMRDMVEKGRSATGDRNGNSKARQ